MDSNGHSDTTSVVIARVVEAELLNNVQWARIYHATFL